VYNAELFAYLNNVNAPIVEPIILIGTTYFGNFIASVTAIRVLTFNPCPSVLPFETEVKCLPLQEKSSNKNN